MKLIFTLAWRNVWRNRRRTILTIAAISFATLLTIVMRGFTEGTWIYNVRNTVELFSGYLQIQREGYQDNPSLHKTFSFTREIEQLLHSTPGVTGYAPRILTDGLVCHHDRSAGSLIFGLDPVKEKNVSRLSERVKRGHFFSPESHDEVVVGEKLLGKLEAEIGDTIIILTQAFDGTLGNMRYRVVGTVKLGIPEFDESSVFMSVSSAQELLAMEGKIHIIALSVTSMDAIDDVREKVIRSLDQESMNTLSVLTWEEVMPELKQAMEFDRIGDIIFLGILIVIVTFGILNTVLMSVTERFREFGITLAIGLANTKLMALVLIETLFITIIGLTAGNIGGYVLNLYFSQFPITLSGEFEAIYAEYGFLPLIIASTSIKILVTVTLSILVISLSANIYPLYKVSRLAPLKGIRYT